MFIFTNIFLYLFVPNVYGLEIFNLSGEWVLKSDDNQYVDIPALVPGGVYTDLMNNKIIPNVFLAYNDINSRWVSRMNWTYTKHFEVTSDLLEHNNIVLKLEGVDTFATILLNGIQIGKTDNMFVEYTFVIKENLKLGNNILEVAFESAVTKSKNLYDIQLADYLVPPICVPTEYRGECHVNHIRKMQASFSWDWGPALPSMGLWKNVTITAYNNTIIKYVRPTIESVGDTWQIFVTTHFEQNSFNEIDGTVLLKLFTDVDAVEIMSTSILPSKEGDYINTQTITIPKSNVKLWWPNRYGDQNLYVLKVTFSDGIEEVVRRVKIGFRTVELLQDEVASGNLFYFRVNGLPIFAKGTNSIPVHLLPELDADPARVQHLLTSAAAVHMNMIRVWGGGLYESDRFYELADELGIMVWQDFMFACSMYPVNEEYLSTVRDEVRHQVRRLQHHTSIVLWAGNNENEAALRQNWYGTEIDFAKYKADFIQLYVDTIKPIVLDNDPSRPYLTSSPTNGVQSEKEGHVAMKPASNLYGDVHFYNYVLDSWDTNIYPVTRFASEYGYQSFPSINTMLKVVNDTSELAIDGPFIDHIQHHPLGNTELSLLMRYRLTLPPPGTQSVNYTRTFLFYTQIAQAQAVRIETEHYRQWRSDTNANGEGRCMGALYWQLSDVWVGPTWAGIDFYGNWKMLHYYAADFFAPMIITSHILPNRNVDIYVVSDEMTNSIGYTASISIYKWTEFAAISTQNITLNITGGSSKKITSYWLDQALTEANCGEMATAKLTCFVELIVYDEAGIVATPPNYIMPSPLKDANVQKAIVTVSNIEHISQNSVIITLKTNQIALYVWLESTSTPGVYSNNGFWLLTAEKTVVFVGYSAIDINEFTRTLTVTHLMDAQYLFP